MHSRQSLKEKLEILAHLFSCFLCFDIKLNQVEPVGSCLSFAFWFVLFFLFGCLAPLSTFVSTSPNATRFIEVLGVGGGTGDGSLLAW